MMKVDVRAMTLAMLRLPCIREIFKGIKINWTVIILTALYILFLYYLCGIFWSAYGSVICAALIFFYARLMRVDKGKGKNKTADQ